ncbi:hypothetical protein QBZ16_003580 [Prototheca wickerhamii]|uniref:Uncharacterized protein n=1 Tax=Prototheca wickerhamii TaxID=3111 RepID=A0AAD9ILB5_PROWI|nr:hypothetical protein QBZ16_003580 [Prototheca wickerhamii]
MVTRVPDDCILWQRCFPSDADPAPSFARIEALAAVAEDVKMHGTPALLRGLLGQEGACLKEAGQQAPAQPEHSAIAADRQDSAPTVDAAAGAAAGGQACAAAQAVASRSNSNVLPTAALSLPRPSFPGADSLALYFLIEQIVAFHSWTPAEAAVWGQLRALLGWMDDVGRRIACLNLSACAGDKARLLDYVSSLVALAPSTPVRQKPQSPRAHSSKEDGWAGGASGAKRCRLDA